jgi:transcriptional repressor NrdR
LFVVKRDGTREDFSRDKVFESLRIACRKRPISVDRLRDAVDLLERELVQEYEDEVRTREIGSRVMRILSGIDTVAYVRFASVYQEFETVADFAQLVDRVQEEDAIRPLRCLQESLL